VIDRKNVARTNFARASLFAILLSLGFASQVWAQTVAGSITAISGSATIARSGKTIPPDMASRLMSVTISLQRLAAT
jgi:hypothetical protein